MGQRGDMRTISTAFGAAASTYDAYAGVQETVARNLMERLAPSFDDAGAGKRILEIGAGTGLLTMQLLEKYPNASFLITDVSQDMLDTCQGKVTVWDSDHPIEALRSSRIEFRILDGQDITSGLAGLQDVGAGPFDLIASSMTAHWFSDPIRSFEIWQKHLSPNGQIIYAIPGKDNFSWWKNHLKGCGLDFGGRVDLPDVLPGQAYQDNITICYKSFRAFCIMLDKTGAGTPKEGYIKPDLADLLNAARGYQEKNNRTFPGDWDIRYGRLFRNSALLSPEYGG
jgi:SAM-dependent methyltransferase